MSENPFIGLRAFDYEQRERFFGRERQSYALYRLTAFGFIAVIGNSGSGKSSLVRAGLFPLLLDEKEDDRWRIAVMTPRGAPLERLADAIATLGPEGEDDDTHAVRRARIGYLIERSSNGIANALDEMPELAATSVLLVVDQFEEIFRIDSTSREETAAFVALLLRLHERRPSARVLVTMRSDFIGDCMRFSGLPEAVSETQYLVPSLSRRQREAAIVKPIARAGATIEPTLVERLINAVGFESDQLPVLQHALARMWIAADARASARGAERIELTDEDYRAIGTLDGALSVHAEAVMAELPGREGVVEAVFRALSQRDDEGRATRRVLMLRQVIAETGMHEADVLAVVERFRAPDCAFLLPSGGGLTPETRIDVVHEALLRRWQRLTSSEPGVLGWLDRESEDGEYYRSLLARIDNGETTLQLGSVNERYAWWTSVPRTDAWAARYGGRRGRVEAFFAASLAALAESQRAQARSEADERERSKQKARATRRFLVVVSSIATVAIALLVITFLTLLGTQRATNFSLAVQSEFLARDAQSFIARGDTVDAALLALEALPQRLTSPDRPFSWAAYGALTDSLANMRELRDYKLSGSILKIEYSPDGSRFVAHQSDGTIWIWKIGSTKPEHVLRALSRALDVEFSPDGSLVAGGCADGTIHLWNARSGAPIRAIHAYRGQVYATVFSADGTRLLTSSPEDNLTRLYDVGSGRLIREARGGYPAFWNASRTLGTRLITIDGDRSVILWNAALTRALQVFDAPQSSIVDAKLSRDEREVAVAYNDQTTSIYDARSGHRIARLVSRDRPIEWIQFTSDGRRLVTVSETDVRVWDVSTGAVLVTISANTVDDYLPELSRDGQEMLLPSNDGSLGIYSVALGARLVNVAGTSASVGDGAFSPDGRGLLTASEIDGSVREWDISTNASRILDTIKASGLAGVLTANIAIAPGGAVFAAMDTYAVRVYDASTGTTLRTLHSFNANADDQSQLAFSPDGRTLIASGDALSGVDRWEWQHSKELAPIPAKRVPRKFLDFGLTYAPDGTAFASTYHGVTRISDARTGRDRLRIPASHGIVYSLQFSADGARLLTGGADGWIRIYDTHSGASVLAFPAHANAVFDVRFSPDERSIASASADQTVRVWNAADGKPVASLDTDGKAASVAFSSNGKRLLIGDAGGARIWDFINDHVVFSLRGFIGGIEQAEFALHDTRIVTKGSDNTLRLWTVAQLPVCQQAIDDAHARTTHELAEALRQAEFVAPRHSPSILNALLPSQACS